MSQLSLGIIETVGLAAAIEAADVCVKSANVTLIGFELTKGDGMAVIKIEGNIGAVKAAIDAAIISAEKVNKVVSSKIIPRPSNEIDILIRNKDTVGVEKNIVINVEKEPIEPEQELIVEVQIVNLFDEIDESKSMESKKFDLETKYENSSAINDDLFREEIKKKDVFEKEKEEEKAEITEITEITKEKYTCNICKDPNCTRVKGELKIWCIHYKDK